MKPRNGGVEIRSTATIWKGYDYLEGVRASLRLLVGDLEGFPTSVSHIHLSQSSSLDGSRRSIFLLSLQHQRRPAGLRVREGHVDCVVVFTEDDEGSPTSAVDLELAEGGARLFSLWRREEHKGRTSSWAREGRAAAARRVRSGIAGS
ncbi:unnamed protein product [Linum trigynum]